MGTGFDASIIETPYGMAFYVDKNYHNPIKPRTIWDALDVVMAGASWADFFKEPSLANLGWAALDTVSLLPILPSSAYIRKGGKLLLNVDEVKKLAKTPEGLEKIKKALKATDKVSDILEAGRKLAKKYTLSDSVYRDHIVKLHSFYSKEKNKSKDEFLHYEIYYRFDPYRETYLEASSVCKIKIFSGSILQWITENCAKENTLISRYGITLNKIKNFAIGLNNVCDVAIKNKYGLVGIGD